MLTGNARHPGAAVCFQTQLEVTVLLVAWYRIFTRNSRTQQQNHHALFCFYFECRLLLNGKLNLSCW